MLRTIFPALTAFLFAILLTACASNRPSNAVGMAVAPRFLELEEEQSISTFHFPRGLYSFNSEDSAGYYYQAPRGIMTHSFAGFARYEGGIFVRKDNQAKVRGYVMWAAGRTKIGNLSRTRYRFLD